MRNLKFALRMLFKAPFVTTVAVLSLALGIGANTAIFSLFDQLLLRPLPVVEPDRLVNLLAPGPKPGSQSCNQAGDCDAVFSYAMFRDLEKADTPLSGLAAHRAFGASLAYNGQALGGTGMLVSGSYFPLLGLRPTLGRLLLPADDGAIGEPHAVVLSHDYWRTRFGADPGVLNQTMLVNGQTMTIVGVAPAGFSGTTLGTTPQVFVPITMRGLMEPPFSGFDDRRSYWAYVFGRLEPGATREQASAAINSPYHAIINDVEAPLQTGMSAATLERFDSKTITLEPGMQGQSSVHEIARTPLILLFSVTGIVLLIACANIANLLLARSATRTGEMAIRLSVGASRAQLVRQLLLESCLLALIGGVAGLVVARWTLSGIAALLPADATNSLSFSLDLTVLAFAALLSMVTGVLFGLFPAMHSTRPDLAATLKGVSGQPAGTRSAAAFRWTLVTVQIALSMALLASAGLFAKSLVNVGRVDLGLDIDHLVTFGISPQQMGYTAARSRALFHRIEEEFRAVPGVTRVTASLVPVLSGSNWGSSVKVQGFEAGPDTDNGSRFNEIGAGYFRAMGVPLMSGREFTDADALGAPKVAIVNETFTRKFKLGRDAVGKRMSSGRDKDFDTEIVGVVQDAKYSEVKDEVPPLFFRPYMQDEQIGDITFYVRTALDPNDFVGTIPALMAKIDSTLPIANARTMPQLVRENVFLDRFISLLSAIFAGLATLLAAIGLYGVLAYIVTQRMREFGLRMALGANPGHVRWLVLRQVSLMTVVGGIVGLALAVGIGHSAAALLFEMQGYDPVVLGASAVLLAIVALVAGLVPALRASRIDPMRALRYE
jgi:putative ABC transport system permease protein